MNIIVQSLDKTALSDSGFHHKFLNKYRRCRPQRSLFPALFYYINTGKSIFRKEISFQTNINKIHLKINFHGQNTNSAITYQKTGYSEGIIHNTLFNYLLIEKKIALFNYSPIEEKSSSTTPTGSDTESNISGKVTQINFNKYLLNSPNTKILNNVFKGYSLNSPNTKILNNYSLNYYILNNVFKGYLLNSPNTKILNNIFDGYSLNSLNTKILNSYPLNTKILNRYPLNYKILNNIFDAYSFNNKILNNRIFFPENFFNIYSNYSKKFKQSFGKLQKLISEIHPRFFNNQLFFIDSLKKTVFKHLKILKPTTQKGPVKRILLPDTASILKLYLSRTADHRKLLHEKGLKIPESFRLPGLNCKNSKLSDYFLFFAFPEKAGPHKKFNSINSIKTSLFNVFSPGPVIKNFHKTGPSESTLSLSNSLIIPGPYDVIPVFGKAQKPSPGIQKEADFQKYSDFVRNLLNPGSLKKRITFRADLHVMDGPKKPDYFSKNLFILALSNTAFSSSFFSNKNYTSSLYSNKKFISSFFSNKNYTSSARSDKSFISSFFSNATFSNEVCSKKLISNRHIFTVNPLDHSSLFYRCFTEQIYSKKVLFNARTSECSSFVNNLNNTGYSRNSTSVFKTIIFRKFHMRDSSENSPFFFNNYLFNSDFSKKPAPVFRKFLEIIRLTGSNFANIFNPASSKYLSSKNYSRHFPKPLKRTDIFQNSINKLSMFSLLIKRKSTVKEMVTVKRRAKTATVRRRDLVKETATIKGTDTVKETATVKRRDPAKETATIKGTDTVKEKEKNPEQRKALFPEKEPYNTGKTRFYSYNTKKYYARESQVLSRTGLRFENVKLSEINSSISEKLELTNITYRNLEGYFQSKKNKLSFTDFLYEKKQTISMNYPREIKIKLASFSSSVNYSTNNLSTNNLSTNNLSTNNLSTNNLSTNNFSKGPPVLPKRKTLLLKKGPLYGTPKIITTLKSPFIPQHQASFGTGNSKFIAGSFHQNGTGLKNRLLEPGNLEFMAGGAGYRAENFFLGDRGHFGFKPTDDSRYFQAENKLPVGNGDLVYRNQENEATRNVVEEIEKIKKIVFSSRETAVGKPQSGTYPDSAGLMQGLDMAHISEKVYQLIGHKMKIEAERRGIL